MSSQVKFVTRDRCPWASSSEPEVLIDRPFSHPSIWNFLDAYYMGRIDRDVLDGASYRLLRCKKNGFVWQEQVLSDEWMQTLYSEWISPEHSRAKKADGPHSLFALYARQAGVVARLFPNARPNSIRVLDFGMGWGYWCRMAAAHGFDVTGADVDDQRRAPPRVRWVCTSSTPYLKVRGSGFISSTPNRCWSMSAIPSRSPANSPRA